VTVVARGGLAAGWRQSSGARVRDHRLVPYQAIGREALDRIEALLAVRSAELWDVV
jgi:hypothetical protein